MGFHRVGRKKRRQVTQIPGQQTTEVTRVLRVHGYVSHVNNILVGWAAHHRRIGFMGNDISNQPSPRIEADIETPTSPVHKLQQIVEIFPAFTDSARMAGAFKTGDRIGIADGQRIEVNNFTHEVCQGVFVRHRSYGAQTSQCVHRGVGTGIAHSEIRCYRAR